jgi:hypothetical protein
MVGSLRWPITDPRGLEALVLVMSRLLAVMASRLGYRLCGWPKPWFYRVRDGAFEENGRRPEDRRRKDTKGAAHLN